MSWKKWRERLNSFEASFAPLSEIALKAVMALLVSIVWLLLPLAGLPGHADVWLTGVALGAGAIATYGWLRDDKRALSFRPEAMMSACDMAKGRLTSPRRVTLPRGA